MAQLARGFPAHPVTTRVPADTSGGATVHDGQGTGATTTSGAAAVTLTMAAAAAGATTTSGTAAVTATLAAAAAGAVTTGGAAAATLTMTAAATGATTTGGTAAGVLTMTAAATGAVTTGGTADATIIPAGATTHAATAAGTTTTGGLADPSIVAAVWQFIPPQRTYIRNYPHWESPRRALPYSRMAGYIPRHANVYLTTDGEVTETQPDSWDTVAAVYYGGHTARITTAEKTVLEAAGYSDSITLATS